MGAMEPLSYEYQRRHVTIAVVDVEQLLEQWDVLIHPHARRGHGREFALRATQRVIVLKYLKSRRVRVCVRQRERERERESVCV